MTLQWLFQDVLNGCMRLFTRIIMTPLLIQPVHLFNFNGKHALSTLKTRVIFILLFLTKLLSESQHTNRVNLTAITQVQTSLSPLFVLGLSRRWSWSIILIDLQSISERKKKKRQHFFLQISFLGININIVLSSWSLGGCFYLLLMVSMMIFLFLCVSPCTSFFFMLCQKMVFTPSKALSLRPVWWTAR